MTFRDVFHALLEDELTEGQIPTCRNGIGLRRIVAFQEAPRQRTFIAIEPERSGSQGRPGRAQRSERRSLPLANSESISAAPAFSL
jgi:hypothetical protein